MTTSGSKDDVQIAPVVLDRMRELPRAVANAVANTILRIPEESGTPLSLPVPGDPADTTYRALLPEPERAPAVIYRHTFDSEQGEWLVTTLMDRNAYRIYTEGLSESQFVQQFATGVAGGTIAANDYSIRTGNDSGRTPTSG